MHTVITPLRQGKASRIAVRVDGSAASEMAVEHAADIARDRGGRLTIIAVAQPPWFSVGLAGVCPRQLQREAMEESQATVLRLAASLPGDVPCTMIVLCGHPARETDRYLQEHEHDILINGPRCERRTPRLLNARRSRPLQPAAYGGWMSSRFAPGPDVGSRSDGWSSTRTCGVC